MTGLVLAAALLSAQAAGPMEQPPLVAGRDVPPPKKLKNVAAPLPDMARRAFPPVEGIILLQIMLNEAGRPVDILVLKETPLLDLAAIEAVKQWEYEPTVVEGTARRVVLKAAVEFFLSPKSRQRYLINVVASRKEDAGLRIYAIQSLAAASGELKDLRKVLEKVIEDKNEAVASAARRAVAAIQRE